MATSLPSHRSLPTPIAPSLLFPNTPLSKGARRLTWGCALLALRPNTVKKWLTKFKHALGSIRDFLDEKAVRSANRAPLSRVHRFAHFWLMVVKSFFGNRCPVHASALAYSTLLALIPMLFVAVSISSAVLNQEGGRRINHFIDRLLVSMTPPSSSAATAGSTNADTNAPETDAVGSAVVSSETNVLSAKPSETAGGPEDAKSVANRQELEKTIDGYMRNIQGGKLGVTGAALLILVAILMLSSIESSLNHIWGVLRGRSWLARVWQYWAVISLGPVLLAVALGLASGPHLESTRQFLETKPFVSRLLFQFAPVAVLCLAFALFYFFMPNTRVHWDAALVGGLVGGALWFMNNYFSALYVSRWVTNSQIYGRLAVIPVLMAGLYFSWLILLFGAQVAHAFQNRAAYLQEKQTENINQRGREFVALRLMECVGQRFQRGLPPATVPEIADTLVAPTRLVQQIMQALLAAQLVVEVAGVEPAFAPARPLENISCHDILLALRAGQGEELATRDDPARAEVFGDFERILAAEKQAASLVTVLAMVNRTEKLAALSNEPVKTVTDAQPRVN